MRILIVGIDVFNLSKIRQPYNICPKELAKTLGSTGNEVKVITNGEQTAEYRTSGIEVELVRAGPYHFSLMLNKILKAEAGNTDAICAFIPIIFTHCFPSLRPPSKPPVVNTIFTDKLKFGDFFSTSWLWLDDVLQPTFKGYSPYTWARLFYPDVILESTLRANRIDQLVVATEYMRRRITRRFPRVGAKIDVIPQGVDTSKFSPASSPRNVRDYLREKHGIQEKDCVITFLGCHDPHRGLNDLIRAFSATRHVLPHLKLLILVYNKRNLKGLLNFIAKSGLRSRVRLVAGALPEETLINYLALSDIVTLPFRYYWPMADLPFTILEAMSMGKPVVTTSLGGIPEIAGSEGAAVLCPPSNVDALGEALIALASDENLRLKIGGSARLRVRRFYSWERASASFLKVLNHLRN